MEQTCANCETKFIARVNVKSQSYCGQSGCQKARKKKWQQQKLRSDQDYRQNQAAAQASWRKRHPNYWREYRAQHADYVKRNRILQHERNQKRRPQTQPMIAKMDASTAEKVLQNKTFTRYQLIPVGEDGVIAKMDACIVEIREISSVFGYPVLRM